jgi:threonine dehydrogenase-like Zn-dependent dehydrogenase
MKGEVLESGFPLVVEATGNEEGLNTALQVVAPRGTVVLKSTYREAPSIDVSKVVVNEIRLIGSRCGPFPKAINLLKDKKINVADVLERDYPLEHAPRAFEFAGKPGTLKVCLTP